MDIVILVLGKSIKRNISHDPKLSNLIEKTQSSTWNKRYSWSIIFRHSNLPLFYFLVKLSSFARENLTSLFLAAFKFILVVKLLFSSIFLSVLRGKCDILIYYFILIRFCWTLPLVHPHPLPSKTKIVWTPLWFKDLKELLRMGFK